jgi:hypothetical protein
MAPRVHSGQVPARRRNLRGALGTVTVRVLAQSRQESRCPSVSAHAASACVLCSLRASAVLSRAVYSVEESLCPSRSWRRDGRAAPVGGRRELHYGCCAMPPDHHARAQERADGLAACVRQEGAWCCGVVACGTVPEGSRCSHSVVQPSFRTLPRCAAPRRATCGLPCRACRSIECARLLLRWRCRGCGRCSPHASCGVVSLFGSCSWCARLSRRRRRPVSTLTLACTTASVVMRGV